MVLGMMAGVGLEHCQGNTDNDGDRSGIGDGVDGSGGDIDITEDGGMIRAILWNILPTPCRNESYPSHNA